MLLPHCIKIWVGVSVVPEGSADANSLKHFCLTLNVRAFIANWYMFLSLVALIATLIESKLRKILIEEIRLM